MTPEIEATLERIAEQRVVLLERLRIRPRGLSWCEQHTVLMDEVLSVLHKEIFSDPNLPAVAIIATGGYGRRELCPFSDIDLTVVPEDETSAELDSAIRKLFKSMHTVFSTKMRLTVGYAYRLIADAPGIDAKTRTGLLDMRLVAGSYDLFRRLERALEESFSAGEFVLAKIREREAMFQKFHDTPLVVEPNIKEGAGGLRDFHCANWLRAATSERTVRPPAAYDEIVRVRNLLHLVAGKPLDQLSRGRQQEIAEILGLSREAMMSAFTSSAEKVHEQYLRAKERIHEARFELAQGVISVQGEARVIGQIDAGRVGIGIAVATKLGLKISNLPVAPPSAVDGPAAIFALSTGEATIRNLDRCGLLSYLLPELTACRNVLPEDTVHAYTVFEHTLRAVRNLDQVPNEGFLSEARDSLIDLEPLYAATLLHDVGRLYGELGHETIGAEIALKRCQSWSLSEDLSQSIVWLIANHLEMSRFIRSRDLQNPATIEEFAQFVGDVDRLRQLTLLTYADIKAVNDSTLTPALLSFLRELYERTVSRLSSDSELVADPAVYRRRLVRQLRGVQTDEEALQRFVETLPAHYVMSTSPDLVQLHFEFAGKASRGESTVELFHRPDIGATDFTVCTLDSPGVLSRVLGVIYAHDLSVVGIRAATTNSDPAIAIDVFTLHFGGRPVPPATCKHVSSAILGVLDGGVDISTVLDKHAKDPDRRQDVFSYVYLVGTPGILEFRSPRGRGVAYRFAKMIAEQKWNVLSARVGQWAGNATAAFYVEGDGHRSLTTEEVEAALGSQA